MAEIGRWGGIKFEVKSGYVLGFSGLSVKGSSETEDKSSNGEKYVSRKNGKPTEITLTVHLNAMTGCNDVRESAMAFVDAARTGKKDYFYIKNSKLVTCQVMLTDAQVKEIRMTGKAEWISCDVALTLKQCTKMDGATSTPSSGSTTKTYKVQISGMSVLTIKATSVQAAITKACGNIWTGWISVDGKSYYVVKGKISTNPNTNNKTNTNAANAAAKIADAVKTTAQNIVSAATSVINKLVSAAKAASSAQKTTTTKTTTTTTTTVTKPILKIK